MARDVKHEPLSMTSFFTCRLCKCCTRQWSSFSMTASVLRDCRSKTHDLPVHESMMPRQYSVSLRSATEHTLMSMKQQSSGLASFVRQTPVAGAFLILPYGQIGHPSLGYGMPLILDTRGHRWPCASCRASGVIAKACGDAAAPRRRYLDTASPNALTHEPSMPLPMCFLAAASLVCAGN